jgi:hypothetical protein
VLHRVLVLAAADRLHSRAAVAKGFGVGAPGEDSYGSAAARWAPIGVRVAGPAHDVPMDDRFEAVATRVTDEISKTFHMRHGINDRSLVNAKQRKPPANQTVEVRGPSVLIRGASSS